LAAAALQSASAALAVVARRIAEAPLPEAGIDPRLEFYAQAGAPEGALYVDGQLVGIVPGVSRL
jgi:hypothetical protein